MALTKKQIRHKLTFLVGPPQGLQDRKKKSNLDTTPWETDQQLLMRKRKTLLQEYERLIERFYRDYEPDFGIGPDGEPIRARLIAAGFKSWKNTSIPSREWEGLKTVDEFILVNLSPQALLNLLEKEIPLIGLYQYEDQFDFLRIELPKPNPDYIREIVALYKDLSNQFIENRRVLTQLQDRRRLYNAYNTFYNGAGTMMLEPILTRYANCTL